MARLARLSFLIGSIAFVVIGLLHTQVHVADLSAPELATRFDRIGPIALQGVDVRAWDLFQGVSLLMGFFSATLGVVLILVWVKSRTEPLPNPLISAAVIVQLAAIVTVGALYLSPFQVIGGLVGIVLFGLPMFAAQRARH